MVRPNKKDGRLGMEKPGIGIENEKENEGS